MKAEDLGLLSKSEAARLRAFTAIAEIKRRKAEKSFYELFPEETKRTPRWMEGVDNEKIYARDLYPRHMEFFEAGKDYSERTFMAANRVGKTFAGGYELSCHLTGEYPDWWPGRKFNRPIRAWAAGKTFETTRDILQAALCGTVLKTATSKRVSGTGLIPGKRIMHGLTTWKNGVADLVDTMAIRHTKGGISRLGFKGYHQGRGAFEGTAQHVILFDEEPPMDVYNEALIRTATTKGITMLTFTPLEGLSEVVLSFLPSDFIDDEAAKSALDMV